MSFEKGKIEINVDENGHGKFLINGEDISNHVSGISIRCKPGRISVVTIEFLGDVIFQGDALTENKTT